MAADVRVLAKEGIEIWEKGTRVPGNDTRDEPGVVARRCKGALNRR